jgi:pilus assembly protein CpaF
MTQAELLVHAESVAARLCAREPALASIASREAMVRAMIDEIHRFGPLQPLIDDADVSEILVSGPDSVWVERGGFLYESEVRFCDDAHLLQFIRRLAERAGRRLDARSPMLETTLPDGTHVQALVPPLTLRGPSLSIRPARAAIHGFDDLLRAQALAPEMVQFLVAAVRGRLNILVSGADGAGKTTLLMSLARFVLRGERVVTIENTPQLDIPQAEVVALQASGGDRDAGRETLSSTDLLRTALQMRPDRIIVDDLGGERTSAFLEALDAGCDGSMFAVAVADPRDALARIAAAVPTMRDCGDQALPVAKGVEIAVHLARLSSGERKVVSISELCAEPNGSWRIEEIFVFRQAGLQHGRSVGQFYATGYEPRSLARMASIGVELEPELFFPRELGTTLEPVAT